MSLHTELGRTHCAEGIDKPEPVPLARGHCKHFQRGVGYEASVRVLEGRLVMPTFFLQRIFFFGVSSVPHHKMGEHRLRMIENRVLGRVYGQGKERKREQTNYSIESTN